MATRKAWSVAFGPENRLAWGRNRAVRIWDVGTGALVHTLVVAALAPVRSVSFGGNDWLAAGGDPMSVYVWNWRNQQLVHTFERSGAEKTTQMGVVAFCEEGDLLASGDIEHGFVYV